MAGCRLMPAQLGINAYVMTNERNPTRTAHKCPNSGKWKHIWATHAFQISTDWTGLAKCALKFVRATFARTDSDVCSIRYDFEMFPDYAVNRTISKPQQHSSKPSSKHSQVEPKFKHFKQRVQGNPEPYPTIQKQPEIIISRTPREPLCSTYSRVPV